MSDSTPIVWLDGRQASAQPALRLAASDNVAVALRTLKPGETVSIDKVSVQVSERVMKGHKIALCDLTSGSRVVKYSQLIGLASQNIAAGEHVHTHNLAFTSNDATGTATDSTPRAPVDCTDSFMGYRRSDGRAGTRNFIAVVSSVNCSATVAHRIADSFNAEVLNEYDNIDGVAAFTHGTGCGMDAEGEGFANLQRVIAGFATHPNVGGVLIVGLGCETSQIAGTIESHKLASGPLLRTMNIQTTGGHVKTIARGVELINEMLPEVNACARSECPASDLSLALQCGGSDAWSGITANPALGYAADLLIKQGGTAVLAETPEIYGAEHLLIDRAVTADVAEQLMQRIHWWQDYVARNNGSLDNNPSPGNKLGGLTTILEKSLGAVAKGGSTALSGVFRYAEQVSCRGFVFMDSPGYDPASVTGQIASGCNLVAFTTGRGSTFGSKPAPCMKIATNTDMYRKLQDDMDINAGTIVSDGETVAAVGERIYHALLAMASGKPTLSETHGLGDNEFVPWQIGATM
ncbi:MAG: UxaA family hydrolase [Granulosicoccus sp.]